MIRYTFVVKMEGCEGTMRDYQFSGSSPLYMNVQESPRNLLKYTFPGLINTHSESLARPDIFAVYSHPM